MDFRKIKRYKYTIYLSVFVVFLIGFISILVVKSNDCEKKGGSYVTTFPAGYSCVDEEAP